MPDVVTFVISIYCVVYEVVMINIINVTRIIKLYPISAVRVDSVACDDIIDRVQGQTIIVVCTDVVTYDAVVAIIKVYSIFVVETNIIVGYDIAVAIIKVYSIFVVETNIIAGYDIAIRVERYTIFVVRADGVVVNCVAAGLMCKVYTSQVT